MKRIHLIYIFFILASLACMCSCRNRTAPAKKEIVKIIMERKESTFILNEKKNNQNNEQKDFDRSKRKKSVSVDKFLNEKFIFGKNKK